MTSSIPSRHIPDCLDWIVVEFDNHIALTNALLVGSGGIINIRDKQSHLIFGKSILLPQFTGQRRQQESKFILFDRLTGVRRGSNDQWLGFLPPCNLDGECHFFALTEDHDWRKYSYLCIANHAHNAPDIINLDTIKRKNDISDLEPCVACWSFRDIHDYAARRFIKSYCISNLRGHFLENHTDPSSTCRSKLLQLGYDFWLQPPRTWKTLFRGSREEPPIPRLVPIIAVFTPMTSPSILNSGPPELPTLIAASVCKKSSYVPRSDRFLAEMMPAETENPRPWGFPIASTGSPTLTCSLSPRGGKRKPAVSLHFQQSNVGFGICSDDFGSIFLTVVQLDGDFSGVFNDVIIGYDVPVRVNDETRPQRHTPPHAIFRTVALIVVVPEEFPKRGAPLETETAASRQLDCFPWTHRC